MGPKTEIVRSFCRFHHPLDVGMSFLPIKGSAVLNVDRFKASSAWLYNAQCGFMNTGPSPTSMDISQYAVAPDPLLPACCGDRCLIS